jgi:CelD/BcsL family acetyltransferase involved in cellulose biosynthesis
MGNTAAALDRLSLAGPKVTRAQAVADRCEVVSDFRRLEQYSSQWERLWQSDPRAEIFQTFSWARAWWHAFGHRYNLCSLVVFSGDEVIGIVPLVERDGCLQFLGTPEADYADILCEERHAVEVLSWALRTLSQSVKGWEECAFRHLSKHSRVARHYRELPRQLRARLHCVTAERQHTIILRQRREDVFKSLLGKHHTRRIQNKLRKAGRVRFHHVETAQAAAQYLPAFFLNHVRRHAVVGRESSCAVPEFCEFMRELTRELLPSGNLRFGVLELDGQPLAWAFAFEVNGKYLLYQHTFDLDAWHYTPGELLLWNTLEYARGHVPREFDFGKGDELYKDRFANYSRETFSLYAEPRNLGGRMRGLGRSFQALAQPVLNRIKQIAKSRPATVRAFRELRMSTVGLWGSLRQARNNGSLLRYGLEAAAGLFHNSVWSKRATDVFALEASTGASASPSLASQNQRDCEVRAAQFGELVDLAWQHPSILSLNQLPQCRKRMRDGDQVYLVLDHDTVTGMFWASIGADTAAGSESKPTAGAPAITLEESWRASGSELLPSYRALLSTLKREAASQQRTLLVHCTPEQSALRAELQRQGFVARYQAVRYKVFHRFQRESVSMYPHGTLRTSQAG